MEQEIVLSKEDLLERQDPPSLLDKALEKVTSRKLMVWLTATGLLLWSNLESSDWVAISLVYIGSQAAVDLAAAWKRA
jgi:hypothetical protein